MVTFCAAILDFQNFQKSITEVQVAPPKIFLFNFSSEYLIYIKVLRSPYWIRYFRFSKISKSDNRFVIDDLKNPWERSVKWIFFNFLGDFWRWYRHSLPLTWVDIRGIRDPCQYQIRDQRPENTCKEKFRLIFLRLLEKLSKIIRHPRH